MALGFTRLLAGADDLALDIPDAAHLLSLFLGGRPEKSYSFPALPAAPAALLPLLSLFLGAWPENKLFFPSSLLPLLSLLAFFLGGLAGGPSLN